MLRDTDVEHRALRKSTRQMDERFRIRRTALLSTPIRPQAGQNRGSSQTDTMSEMTVSGTPTLT